MRGVRPATRYHDGLKSEPLIGGWPGVPRLRQPGPELQAEPVDHLPRPDPHERAPVDLDLAHALHAGTQALEPALEPGLHAEVVAAVLLRGDRGDLVHDERQAVGGRTG